MNENLQKEQAKAIADIAYAALDVLKSEPMSETCPLYNAPNCIITPHIAGSADDVQVCGTNLVIESLLDYLQGIKPLRRFHQSVKQIAYNVKIHHVHLRNPHHRIANFGLRHPNLLNYRALILASRISRQHLPYFSEL